MRTPKEQVMKKLIYSIVFLVPLFYAGLGAQEDDGYVVDSDDIDIDGTFERPTEADRIRKLREDNRRKAHEQFDRQLEREQLEGEKRLQKNISDKLDKAFTGGDISAPQDEKSASSAAASSNRLRNTVSPHIGLTSFQGDDVDYDSSATLGVSIESLIKDNMAVGIGFSYTSMEVVDPCSAAGTLGYTGYGGYPFVGSGYGAYCSAYTGFYGGQGRTMEYKKISFSVLGKFFFGSGTKIRPYFGFGVGYNRVTMRYENNNNFYGGYSWPGSWGGNYSYGDEGLTSGYVTGMGIVGGEIAFSESIGMSLELSYSKSVTGSIGRDGKKDIWQSPDQLRLQNVGEAIEEAHQIAMGAGIVIKF